MVESRSVAPLLIIDGARFNDLEGFYDEVSQRLVPGAAWGRNLDAFNDILRGGFGTPVGEWILRWQNANLSRERLGYDETMRWLRKKLRTCHRDNVERVREDLRQAERREGQTLFDILVEIIRVHGPGGTESEDGVHLELEGISALSSLRSTAYPCPCCGYVVFTGPPGSYEICPICFWEDDAVQLRDPTYQGGANRPSLVESQQTFVRCGAMEERFIDHVRKPVPDDRRDPEWRQVDLTNDVFEHPPWQTPWPDDGTRLYYWRPAYRRASSRRL